jgi:hypothetical protein
MIQGPKLRLKAIAPRMAPKTLRELITNREKKFDKIAKNSQNV